MFFRSSFAVIIILTCQNCIWSFSQNVQTRNQLITSIPKNAGAISSYKSTIKTNSINNLSSLMTVYDYVSNKLPFKFGSLKFEQIKNELQSLKVRLAILPVLLETTKNIQQNNITEWLKEVDQRIDVISDKLKNEDNIPIEMEKIMRKNADKSNRKVADLLYSYLSDRYATKHWLVITYDALGGFKDHKFWNFDHFALRHEGKNAVAISFKRNMLQIQRSFGDLESKFYDYCIRKSIMSDQRVEMCQRRRQPSAEKLGQQLREKGIVELDSHFAVIHGGIEAIAHPEIKYYLGPSQRSSSSYTFLVVPGRPA